MFLCGYIWLRYHFVDANRFQFFVKSAQAIIKKTKQAQDDIYNFTERLRHITKEINEIKDLNVNIFEKNLNLSKSFDRIHHEMEKELLVQRKDFYTFTKMTNAFLNSIKENSGTSEIRKQNTISRREESLTVKEMATALFNLIEVTEALANEMVLQKEDLHIIKDRESRIQNNMAEAENKLNEIFFQLDIEKVSLAKKLGEIQDEVKGFKDFVISILMNYLPKLTKKILTHKKQSTQGESHSGGTLTKLKEGNLDQEEEYMESSPRTLTPYQIGRTDLVKGNIFTTFAKK